MTEILIQSIKIVRIVAILFFLSNFLIPLLPAVLSVFPWLHRAGVAIRTRGRIHEKVKAEEQDGNYKKEESKNEDEDPS
jgi:hypothetical protein